MQLAYSRLGRTPEAGPWRQPAAYDMVLAESQRMNCKRDTYHPKRSHG